MVTASHKSGKVWLNYDQQKPLEEPVDAEKGAVTQYLFRRSPPTLEDRFFYEEEHSRVRIDATDHHLEIKGHLLRAGLLPASGELDRPEDARWLRVYRALTRHWDTGWRP